MRFANAMDNATWTPHTKQAGQYTGPGRGLDVPSSDVMSLIQLDYILTSPKFSTEKSWCDFSIPIGLDHRCVHCLLLFKMIFYFLPSSDYGQSPCEDYIRCVY